MTLQGHQYKKTQKHNQELHHAIQTWWIPTPITAITAQQNCSAQDAMKKEAKPNKKTYECTGEQYHLTRIREHKMASKAYNTDQ